MRYRNWDKTLWSSYHADQDKTRVRAVSKSYLLCYTREWVKREEKEILQHQSTSLYIHFICHPQIIPHAPLYHPNILSWSYTPSTQLLITITTPHHPTSQYLTLLPYHNKLYCHHLTIFPRHLRVYQHLGVSVTLIPSIHLIPFVSTFITRAVTPMILSGRFGASCQSVSEVSFTSRFIESSHTTVEMIWWCNNLGLA